MGVIAKDDLEEFWKLLGKSIFTYQKIVNVVKGKIQHHMLYVPRGQEEQEIAEKIGWFYPYKEFSAMSSYLNDEGVFNTYLVLLNVMEENDGISKKSLGEVFKLLVPIFKNIREFRNDIVHMEYMSGEVISADGDRYILAQAHKVKKHELKADVNITKESLTEYIAYLEVLHTELLRITSKTAEMLDVIYKELKVLRDETKGDTGACKLRMPEE